MIRKLVSTAVFAAALIVGGVASSHADDTPAPCRHAGDTPPCDPVVPLPEPTIAHGPATGVLAGASAYQPAVRMSPPAPAFVIDDMVTGGQTELNEGLIVLLDSPTCWPGSVGCTVYLAGHRSSHGSPFAEVANLEPGDIVKIAAEPGVAVDHYYRVTEHALLCCYHSEVDVRGDLMLQTSALNNQVHMIYAQEIGGRGNP